MKETIDIHKIFAEHFKGIESLAYGVSSKLASGNICLDIEEYKEELPLLLEEEKNKESFKDDDSRFWVGPDEFDKQCKDGAYVTTAQEELKPFVILNGQAYLHRYFIYESKIIENIKRLRNNFRIITGGPGTGKTYSVSLELKKLYEANPDTSVALAAPTGKAAARMNESLADYAGKKENKVSQKVKEKFDILSAQTLHRLLGPQHDSVFFKYNEENRLPFDVVIVDECSMIDGAMMAKLLDAIDDNTKLYFLGDKDQLASVEAGSIFGDLCRLRESSLLKDRVEVKVESWRFDPDKGIGKFSNEVISGSVSSINAYDGDEQICIDTDFKESLFREQALLYKDYIKEKDILTALKKLNNIRFLCVTRQNERSVSETNERIQKILKNELKDPDLFQPKTGFYHNQPIIVTKNDYTLDIYNGDVGIIRRDGDVLFAYFEDALKGTKRIQAGYLNHYDTVFAMTIHKSQGSEFTNVVVLLPEKQGDKLLTRELLYTGVTRAMKKALIQSSEEVLLKCVAKEVSRSSGLANQITSA